MAKKKQAGRPKKPAGHTREQDLRIPVTSEEKQRVQAAAEAAGERGEMAAWARAVLLNAADKQLASGTN